MSSKIAIAALAGSIMFVPSVATAETIDLRCSLQGAVGTREYVLRVEIPSSDGEARVRWVGAIAFDLEIVRLDDTNLIAAWHQKMSGWPEKADSMWFYINRISGAAEVTYTRRANPEKTHSPWDTFPQVLVEATETGLCNKVKAAF